jgi:hypothetical protein
VANTTLTPNVASAALTGAQAGTYPNSALLFVSEFASPLVNGPAGGGFLLCPSLADQVIAISGISAASAPFSSATRGIRVQSTAIAAVKVGGKAPVAVAGLIGGTARVTAGQTEIYAVNPGDAVAVVASS